MERKSWKEFQNSGLLWWTNRTLHLFGWVIVFEEEEDGAISNVYPARSKWRGFTQESENNGFEALTKYMKDNSDELADEVFEQ